VDLHGQHQTIELVDPATQRALLDAFGAAEPAARAAASAFDRLAGARAEYAALVARRDDAQRRADWLRHVVAEIDAARPSPGEEEALAGEANRLSQSGALAGHAAELIGAIDDDDSGGRTALGRAERALHALERIDPAVADWRELIDTAYTALDELARRAVEYQSALTDDPGRRAEVEQRRDLLAALRRKHGESIVAVLAVRDAAPWQPVSPAPSVAGANSPPNSVRCALRPPSAWAGKFRGYCRDWDSPAPSSPSTLPR